MKAEKVRSILEFGKSCKGLLGEESVGVTISTRRIKEALAEIDDLEAAVVLLAKLASDKPELGSPVEVAAAQTVRDEILKKARE